jgi:tryptophan-rich sensory protein
MSRASRRYGVLAIAGPLAAAGVGSLGSRSAPQVYPQLVKPSWAPPAQVFGPVWTLLYAGIGAAGWRLRRHTDRRALWTLHLTQLALNAVWPYTFFTVGSRRSALAVIAALDVTVAAEIGLAARADRSAAALLVPYLAWSAYATALTAAIPPPRAVQPTRLRSHP